jgi:hypothetical protein
MQGKAMFLATPMCAGVLTEDESLANMGIEIAIDVAGNLLKLLNLTPKILALQLHV